MLPPEREWYNRLVKLRADIDATFTIAKTADDLLLDGMVLHPRGKKKTALLWIHGLSGTFYHQRVILHELSRSMGRLGVGVAALNNRGFGIVSRSNKHTVGVAFEDFRKCVLDLRAMISRMTLMGYRNVVLVGHSTGANKAVYYFSKTRDRRVKGLVLAGGLSDIAAELKTRAGAQMLRTAVRTAERLVASNRERELMIVGGKYYSASRVVSLYKPHQAEDVFPVYDPKGRWTAMRSVRAPTLVVFGGRDEHMDRSAKELIKLYRSKMPGVTSYDGTVIGGADHGFKGRERQFAAAVSRWFRGLAN